MRFSIVIAAETVEESIRQCLQAERYGFEYAWFPDHFMGLRNRDYAELYTLFGAIAVQTKSICLSPGVTDPVRSHPARIAQAVATLDRISKGRAVLGIGVGEAMNITPYGIPWDSPVTRLREAIEVITGLWTSSQTKRKSYAGMFYKLDQAFLQISPHRIPHPPIYVGAGGPRTRRLTGELADGWYPVAQSPEAFQSHIIDVEEGAKTADRQLAELDLVARVRTAISDDRQRAYDAVSNSVKMAVVLHEAPPHLRTENILVSEQSIVMLHDAMKQVPDKVVDEIAGYGTVDDCICKIEEFVKAGATHIAINNHGPDVDRTLKEYGDKIIPYFKEF